MLILSIAAFIKETNILDNYIQIYYHIKSNQINIFKTNKFVKISKGKGFPSQNLG